MEELSNLELENIKGGGFSIGLALAILGSISFLIGVFNGFMNPESCNE